VLVLGENELTANEGKLKRMADGQETTTALDAESIYTALI
jgi:histidyl-tRNA synthetase